MCFNTKTEFMHVWKFIFKILFPFLFNNFNSFFSFPLIELKSLLSKLLHALVFLDPFFTYRTWSIIIIIVIIIINISRYLCVYFNRVLTRIWNQGVDLMRLEPPCYCKILAFHKWRPNFRRKEDLTLIKAALSKLFCATAQLERKPWEYSIFWWTLIWTILEKNSRH